MFDRKLLKNLNWLFILNIVVLLAFCLVVLASASRNVSSTDPYYIIKKQVIFVGIGFIAMAFLAWFDYRRIGKLIWLIYGATMVLLVAVLFTEEKNGASSWFDFGFVSFQPSEFAKLVTILTLAYYLASKQDRIEEYKTFFGCFAITALPLGLILLEPDLGTALVFLAIIMGMMLIAGIPGGRLLALVAAAAGVIGVLYGALFIATDGFESMLDLDKLPFSIPLATYQLMRLIIFINPYMDPLDTGYNMIQSMIAAGSGGFWGKGYGSGSQVQGNFLPEHHTDFIVASMAEEFGFIGSIFFLTLYLLLMLQAIRIAYNSSDLFGTLIISGIISMLAFQVLVNFGMAIGIMPITGIPIPFLTYGGSSMLLNMMGLGIIISINLRQKETLF